MVEDLDYNHYNEHQNFQPTVKFDRPIVVKAFEKPKNQQDFSKIPGIPGVDFPLYHTVPPTSFSCAHVPFVPGMYANVETGCQVIYLISSIVLQLIIEIFIYTHIYNVLCIQCPRNARVSRLSITKPGSSWVT